MSAVPQRRILVVEDEPIVSEAVRQMLAFDGHVVQTAGSGREALSLLKQSLFDVVITDYAMPVMRGDELAATIKARHPNLPVVMITAYAESLQSGGALPPGVDFLISKPFLLSHLREAISVTTRNQQTAPGSRPECP